VAKEKIRKLLRQREILTKRLNEMTGMLALLAHQNGGQVSFLKTDMAKLPDAYFQIESNNETVTLLLKYDNKPEEAPEPEKQVEEAETVAA
jgi:hypothetical protein